MSAPPLVPELEVSDLSESLGFWCGVLGFARDERRDAPGFAYLTRGDAHVMLDERVEGADWFGAALERPFGRGAHLRVCVDDLEPLLSAIRGAGLPLVREPGSAVYGAPGHEVAVTQFMVADPDGHLLRFQAPVESDLGGC